MLCRDSKQIPHPRLTLVINLSYFLFLPSPHWQRSSKSSSKSSWSPLAEFTSFAGSDPGAANLPWWPPRIQGTTSGGDYDYDKEDDDYNKVDDDDDKDNNQDLVVFNLVFHHCSHPPIWRHALLVSFGDGCGRAEMVFIGISGFHFCCLLFFNISRISWLFPLEYFLLISFEIFPD